jgi:hypothetical protein
VKDLEKKKQMLIAESEVHRQALKLELQNLRLSALQTRQRLRSFNPANRIWMLAVAAVASLWTRRIRRRRFPLWRMGGLAMIGWQVANRVVPFCRGLFSRRRRWSNANELVEDRTTRAGL